MWSDLSLVITATDPAGLSAQTSMYMRFTPARVEGTAGDDHLVGVADGELLMGLDGNDTIEGNDGDDFLEGDAGNDTLNGGTGIDYMEGGTGDDIYFVDNAGGESTRSS